MSKIPVIKWYQRRETVHIEFMLDHSPKQDTYQLEVKEDVLKFSVGSYNVDISLAYPVELVKDSDNGRIIYAILSKKEPQTWEKLTTDRNFNRSHVRINWQQWKDEDDTSSDEEGMGAGGGMPDMAEMMQQMGGMGGMGGMEEMMKQMGGMCGIGDENSSEDSCCGDECVNCNGEKPDPQPPEEEDSDDLEEVETACPSAS